MSSNTNQRIWVWLTIPLLISYLLVNDPFRVTLIWSAAQWIPESCELRSRLHQTTWVYWDRFYAVGSVEEPIPKVDVQQHKHNLKQFLVEEYGKDWKRRPLLLQGLWSPSDLVSDHRRLTLSGLLHLNLSIPYFTDARRKKALIPDAYASLRDILHNISAGQPHKIGSQLIVQTYPELLHDVAPVSLVTELFGDYFSTNRLKGTGPFGILPALTTVPIFIASNQKQNPNSTMIVDPAHGVDNPMTALHCEPIGNIAVQLSGKKQWTLVRPEFSWALRPSISPDRRAYFRSNYGGGDRAGNPAVPRYTVVTQAGDALWVPTWTWHQVDYVPSEDVALAASLFHFRPRDFITHNPLFAAVVVPALFLELTGYNTQ